MDAYLCRKLENKGRCKKLEWIKKLTKKMLMKKVNKPPKFLKLLLNSSVIPGIKPKCESFGFGFLLLIVNGWKPKLQFDRVPRISRRSSSRSGPSRKNSNRRAREVGYYLLLNKAWEAIYRQSTSVKNGYKYRSTKDGIKFV